MNAELNRAGLIGVLNVSESTVRRWEEDGMPYTPIGKRGKRYNLNEVKAWLRSREQKCQSGQTTKAASMLALCFGAKEFTDAYYTGRHTALLRSLPIFP